MEAKKLEVLRYMSEVIGQNGFRTEFFDGADGNPPMTRVELLRQGKIRQDVMIDMWFPGTAMARPETALFQMHATMFQIEPGAMQRNMPELKRALFYINDLCTVGHFGLFEQDGVIYMRHNIVLNLEDSMERMITDLCDYYSLMLSGIQRYVDAVAQIAMGAVNIEIAKEMELLPNI